MMTTAVSPRVVYLDSLVTTRVTLQEVAQSAKTAIAVRPAMISLLDRFAVRPRLVPLLDNILIVTSLREFGVLLSEDIAIEGFVLVLGIKGEFVGGFLLRGKCHQGIVCRFEPLLS